MIRIPTETTADELASMLNGDAIPTDALLEDLHAALYQACKILADHEAILAELAGNGAEMSQETGIPAFDPTDPEATLDAIIDLGARLSAVERRAGGRVLVPSKPPAPLPRLKVTGKRADGLPVLGSIQLWTCGECSWTSDRWSGPWVRPRVAECPECGGEATYRMAPASEIPEGGSPELLPAIEAAGFQLVNPADGPPGSVVILRGGEEVARLIPPGRKEGGVA